MIVTVNESEFISFSIKTFISNSCKWKQNFVEISHLYVKNKKTLSNFSHLILLFCLTEILFKQKCNYLQHQLGAAIGECIEKSWFRFYVDCIKISISERPFLKDTYFMLVNLFELFQVARDSLEKFNMVLWSNVKWAHLCWKWVYSIWR